MKLITATSNLPPFTSTRFFIGCEEMADFFAAQLHLHGFTVVMESAPTPPRRSVEEVRRAEQILRLITLQEVRDTH